MKQSKKWLLTGVIDPEEDVESGRAGEDTKTLWATCVTTKQCPSRKIKPDKQSSLSCLCPMQMSADLK